MYRKSIVYIESIYSVYRKQDSMYRKSIQYV